MAGRKKVFQGKDKGLVWIHRLGTAPSDLNIIFSSGRDISPRPPVDELLIPYDLWTNEAHSRMLAQIGILEKAELLKLLSAYRKLSKEFASGKFRLDPMKEDVHMNVEARIGEICSPELAGKIHTGRSRNDQSACDVHLYLRDKNLEIAESLLSLAESLLSLAGRNTETVYPGLTHRQHGAASTIGHLFVSYAQALERDISRFELAHSFLSQSPLGAAQAYGTTYPIDRDLTAKLLAFESVKENSLDSVSSRWDSEAEFVFSLSSKMAHLSVISQDLIFFSTSEVDFARISDEFVTGSSIMPQKRNPDFAETILAKTASVQGLLFSILSVPRGTLSGYNREYQWTKAFAIDAGLECELAPVILESVLKTLEFRKERMEELAHTGFLASAEIAEHVAISNKAPFRLAYSLVSEAVKKSEDAGKAEIGFSELRKVLSEKNLSIKESDFKKLLDPRRNVSSKKSLGSPAPRLVRKNIERLARKLKLHRKTIESKLLAIGKAKKLSVVFSE
jgi:argininosuccinate lyase